MLINVQLGGHLQRLDCAIQLRKSTEMKIQI